MSDKTTWLGPSTGYTDLLDNEIIAEIEHEFNSPRKYNPLRPSSAGKCSRQLAYELAEYRLGWKYDQVEKMKPPTYRLLKLGHSVEWSTIQNFKLLKDFSIKYKQQSVTLFKVQRGKEGAPDEIIEGSMDWVLWSDVHRCICDAKSKKDGGSGQYRYWKKDISKLMAMESVTPISETEIWVDDLPAFIKELNGDYLVDNMIQLNGYACSDFVRERGIDHGLIYRYNKNTSEHFAIRFRPSLDVQREAKAKFDMVSIAVDKEQVDSVPCEYELGTMRCAYCPFSAYCHPGRDVKAAFFNKGKKSSKSSGSPKIQRIKKGEVK